MVQEDMSGAAPEAPPSSRARVRRNPVRARYGRAAVDAVLDVAPLAHVASVGPDGAPRVVPVLCARVGDDLLLHGSSAAAWAPAPGTSRDLAVAVTLMDGLVLARSWFHHSANYRAVVVHGAARRVTDPEECLALARHVVEHLVPGRADASRAPTRKELAATAVVLLPLAEASAKVRDGGPGDDEEDLALDVWAGVVPLPATAGAPVPDPLLPAGASLPEHVRGWAPRWAG